MQAGKSSKVLKRQKSLRSKRAGDRRAGPGKRGWKKLVSARRCGREKLEKLLVRTSSMESWGVNWATTSKIASGVSSSLVSM